MKPQLLSKSMFWASGLLMAALLAFSLNDSLTYKRASYTGHTISILTVGKPLLLAEEAFILFNSKSITQILTLSAVAETPARKTPLKLTGMNVPASLNEKLIYTDKLPPEKLEEILLTYREGSKPFVASVTKNLLDELGIPLGGGFSIGHAKFVAANALQPPVDGAMFAIVSAHALRATRLLGPASKVHYIYNITLPDGVTASEWKIKTMTQFPNAKWQILDPKIANTYLPQ